MKNQDILLMKMSRKSQSVFDVITLGILLPIMRMLDKREFSFNHDGVEGVTYSLIFYHNAY